MAGTVAGTAAGVDGCAAFATIFEPLEEQLARLPGWQDDRACFPPAVSKAGPHPEPGISTGPA